MESNHGRRGNLTEEGRLRGPFQSAGYPYGPVLRTEISLRIRSAVSSLIAAGKLPEAVRDVVVEVSDTKTPEHGDYACNFAMVANKKAGMNPRAIGELLQSTLLADNADFFTGVEVAGPGFLNLRVASSVIAGYVAKVLELRTGIAKLTAENPQRINVEFVSVNPNGPITVGSGRGAAFGDTLCRLLEAAGHTVSREYYINDGVNSEQMRQFAESVKSIIEGTPFPEKGYKGEYVHDVASELKAAGVPGGADTAWYQQASQEMMIARQRGDLAAFGVKFDTWFSEQSLHNSGVVAERIQSLIEKGVADDELYRTKIKFGKKGLVEDVEHETQAENAIATEEDEDSEGTGEGKTLWLRSTKFGDDMDRVLRRRDGRLTYIASDVAYHADKFKRPTDATKLITILGPDHHGYIGRLQAVLAALLGEISGTSTGEPLSEIEAKLYKTAEERDACRAALEEAKAKLEVVIFQIVRFVKDGKPAPMRKRDGNIYELRDLINELGANIAPSKSKEEQQKVGADVARFFYSMRSHDTHMDFDIDLATKQSDENPVFYVQYAHARISSVIAKAAEAGFTAGDASGLNDPRELALIKKILDLPYEIERASNDYGIHRLTTYAVELARSYHFFYDGCRVIQADQPELTRARLALCEAARTTLRATLEVLGISAPDRMDREA